MIRIATLVLAAVLATNVHAQQSEEAIRLGKLVEDTLSARPSVAQLRTLAKTDENAYVYFLQGFLRDRGLLKSGEAGLLDGPTLSALAKFCRTSGIADQCREGPLLPTTTKAVATAVVAALKPPPKVAEPAPVPAPEPVPVLPAGWDISGAEQLGLKAEITSASASAATLHFSGTATTGGTIDIGLTPLQPGSEGTWVVTVTALQRYAKDSTAVPAQLRTAVLDSDGNAGDLFAPIAIPIGAAGALIAGAPTTATSLLPYVQLTVNAGDKVDTTIRLTYPLFGKLASAQ